MTTENHDTTLRLPLHLGTRRGHHETIFDRNGDIVAYTTGHGRERDGAHAQEIVAAVNATATPDPVTEQLITLAREVAKDYPDAADWKDARGRLMSMAWSALAAAGVSLPEDEEDEDE